MKKIQKTIDDQIERDFHRWFVGVLERTKQILLLSPLDRSQPPTHVFRIGNDFYRIVKEPEGNEETPG